MYSYKAKTKKQTSRSNTKYSMFIGRWQPWHEGHRWLIDQRLKGEKKILICIRDVLVDSQNPFSAKKVKKMLEKELKSLIEVGSVKLLIIPDIESINYGRGVGYDVIEHKPPSSIEKISATKIRLKMRSVGLIK